MPEITAEIALIRHLGSAVCPKILGVWHGGYAMERLESMLTAHMDVWVILNILKTHVWNREGSERPNWAGDFRARFGFAPPGWVSERTCLIHGDPTYGNTAWRAAGPDNDGNRVLLLDPKPVGRGIPSFRSVDLGKVLQSLMGWEMALGSQWSIIGWLDLPDDELRRAIFWCGVHFMRIRQREGDTALGYWARDNARLLGELVDVRMAC